MSKPRIYPPRGSGPLPSTRDLSADSEEEFLNVYASLDSLEESDNDVKSIILDQLRKYRHLTLRIKKNMKGDGRYAILTFDNSDALNYFRRAILEKRDRIIVYDKVLFFNFNHTQRNISVHQRVSDRVSNSRDRRNMSYDRNPPRLDHPYERRNNFNRRSIISVSRTLFVGNLDDNIETTEIKRVFEPYGELLEVVIKHPPGNRSAPYAFVKFRKLSSSNNAREQLQETFVGRKRLKIGYGKVSPSHALWIGGLNDGTNEEELLSEVKRSSTFAGHKFIAGENMAYFVFETIEDCRMAYEGLMNTKLVHSGAKLEVDYADTHSEVKDLMENIRVRDGRRMSPSSSHSRMEEKMSDGGRERTRSPITQNIKVNRKRRGSYSSSSYSSPHRSPVVTSRRSPIKHCPSPLNNQEGSEIKSSDKRRIDDIREMNARDSSISPSIRRIKHSKNASGRSNEEDKDLSQLLCMGQKSTLTNHNTTTQNNSFVQILNAYPVVWKGGIAVKNNVTNVQLHIVCGGVDAVSTMVHQATLKGRDPTIIHLTKRFPLLPDRVAHLRSKLAAAIASRDCCILMAQAVSPGDLREPHGLQSKPIQSLINYFHEKQGAGIGSIDGISIYAFPPSPFTQEQLTTLMPHAASVLNGVKDNYLMVVISR